jgi:copper transport protein
MLLALCGGVLLALLAFSPVGPTARLLPIASAHAVLVRSDPTADAILNAPPSHITLWFSEEVNPLTSRVVVVDTANRQVDNHDAHVTRNDPKQMTISVPLLHTGTYVVVWRTQSADDGHVAGGSFIFRIAAPDGSVPPIPSVLPTGNIPGGGGSGDASSGGLDAPGIAQAIFTWLALLGMAFWVGGMIWETWILPSALTADSALRAAAEAAERRFRRLAPIALNVVLLAGVGMVLAQSAELAGSFTGAVSPPLLQAVLFGSRYGAFWWMRELVTLAALYLTLIASRRGLALSLPLPTVEGGTSTAAEREGEIAGFGQALLATVREVRHLPSRLVAGVRARTWPGVALLALAGGLVVAFALSGHAAAVPNDELAYALAVDLLHLICNVAWVGGLLYISLVFVPALSQLDLRTRARVLALGLPEFGAVAILSAFLLAATGSLNTTIHLTSIQQFLTTAYGRTLFVKIELFLLMVGISAWHAFRLRPQLARAVAEWESPAAATSAIHTVSPVGASVNVASVSGSAQIPLDIPRALNGHNEHNGHSGTREWHKNAGDSGQRQAPKDEGSLRELALRLEDWLRREAMLGAAVLLCAALLGAFAGTLVAPAASGSGTILPSQSKPFLTTNQVGGYAVTLNIVPTKFGPNTFTATIKDSGGAPVKDAILVAQIINLDMDMGEQDVSLKPVGASSPGVYSGKGDLTMGGHWQVTIKIVPPGSKKPLTTSFKLTVGYS